MKFEEVLPALREGKNIKRWSRGRIISIGKNHRGDPVLRCSSGGNYDWSAKITTPDILAEDWEIIG